MLISNLDQWLNEWEWMVHKNWQTHSGGINPGNVQKGKTEKVWGNALGMQFLGTVSDQMQVSDIKWKGNNYLIEFEILKYNKWSDI